MSRRRRWGIALGLGCVLLVSAVVGFGSRGGQPRIELIFLGFTNHTVITFSAGSGQLLVTNPLPMAVFMATNSGSRRARLTAGLFGTVRSTSKTHHAYATNMLGVVLKPCESIPVFSSFIANGKPDRARLGYVAHGARDHVVDRLIAMQKLWAYDLARKLSVQHELQETYSEWLTAPPWSDLAPSNSPAPAPAP